MSNPGRINLELIEVQTGSYLYENDIVRLEGMRQPAVGWAVGPLPDLAERGGKQGFVRL